MRSHRPLLLLLALLVGPLQVAQADPRRVDALVARMSEAEALQTAQLLGMCGGVYSAFTVFTQPRAPERSSEYKALGNGALTAGAYLLYREHRQRTGETRPVSDFMPPVREQADLAAEATLAALGAGDFDSPQEKLADCFKMAELQDFLVAAMKDEFSGR